jgi:hypothetical protein
MQEKRIAKIVNDLFYDIIETNEVREQKEELRIHLTERVQEFMQKGLSFEEALAAAKTSLGDPDELISGFERKRAVVVDDLDDDYGVNFHFRVSRMFTKLVSLSPFIYVLMGLTQNTWKAWLPFEILNWWWWGWIIIPVFGILSSGIGGHTITALAPFIYVAVGLLYGGSWWWWGWMIIPVSGILFSSCGKKKKKKKKFNPVFSVHIDNSIDETMEGIGKSIDETMENVGETIENAMQNVEDVFEGIKGNSNRRN